MVRMGMGNKYGVQSCNMVLDTLESQLWCGINEDIVTVFTNKNRGAHPFVFGIVRGTDPAITSDHRNSVRSPCSQKSYLHKFLNSRISSPPSPNPSHQGRGKNVSSPSMGEVRWGCRTVTKLVNQFLVFNSNLI